MNACTHMWVCAGMCVRCMGKPVVGDDSYLCHHQSYVSGLSVKPSPLKTGWSVSYRPPSSSLFPAVGFQEHTAVFSFPAWVLWMKLMFPFSSKRPYSLTHLPSPTALLLYKRSYLLCSDNRDRHPSFWNPPGNLLSSSTFRRQQNVNPLLWGWKTRAQIPGPWESALWAIRSAKAHLQNAGRNGVFLGDRWLEAANISMVR